MPASKCSLLFTHSTLLFPHHTLILPLPLTNQSCVNGPDHGHVAAVFKHNAYCALMAADNSVDIQESNILFS